MEYSDNFTDFMANIGHDIENAIQILKRGELVGIPTETVYGLAGNALDEKVVLKIFKTKNRPHFDPLISHIGRIEMLDQLAEDIPNIAMELMSEFWPGPLTLLLQKTANVPDLLTSGLPRIAIRMPDHPLTLDLLKRLEFPLAAPSANPFGYVSPTTAIHVNQQLGDQISYILDGGATNIGIESTIIGIESGEMIIHRLGGLKLEELETFGKTKLELNQCGNPVAPGNMQSHYAPGKPIVIGIISELIDKYSNVGVISFMDNYAGVKENIVLSEKGNLDEAAGNLFSALRTMDSLDIDIIITEVFPNYEMGRAINDRLQRAAAI